MAILPSASTLGPLDRGSVVAAVVVVAVEFPPALVPRSSSMRSMMVRRRVMSRMQFPLAVQLSRMESNRTTSSLLYWGVACSWGSTVHSNLNIPTNHPINISLMSMFGQAILGSFMYSHVMYNNYAEICIPLLGDTCISAVMY